MGDDHERQAARLDHLWSFYDHHDPDQALVDLGEHENSRGLTTMWGGNREMAMLHYENAEAFEWAVELVEAAIAAENPQVQW